LDAAFEARSVTAGAWMLFQLLLLFGFVFLHELGHSLTAQRLGIRVRDITLWPLGGLARLEGQNHPPKTELKIALSGPAVNFLWVLIAWPFTILWADESNAFLHDVPILVFWINLIMGGFNLIPAFPMDGGRVLRSLLALKIPYLKATEFAVSTGRVLALASIFMALIYGSPFIWGGSFIIVLISLFILWAGSAELRAVRAMAFFQGTPGWKTGEGDTIDADVISSREAQEEDLDDYEKKFIDMIRRYRKEE
jgi:Zn-dependent protease